MSPFVRIRKRDKKWCWLTIDFLDDEDIEAVIVIPGYGPDHNAGMDCWCAPKNDDGVIVHNEVH